MLRASSYNIYVDLPDEPDQMLLVHGYTGAYDKVSRRVASYVRSLENRRPPRPLFGAWSPEPPINGNVVEPSSQAIDILRKRGYLTELSAEKEEEYFAIVASKLHERSIAQNPNYIFMPTYDCNLRCSYCFQDHMRVDPKYQHLLRLTRKKMVDRIFKGIGELEALHTIADSSNIVRNIGFFGGEPLLAENKPIVEYIMYKARAIGGEARFWAVTNGTELKAYKEMIGPSDIQQLQITLDGPPGEHDKRRIYVDGSGSFERIACNITMALDRGTRVSVRMNVDKLNIDQLPTLAEAIIEKGWDKYENFSAYTTPIHAANEKTEVRNTLSSWELDKRLTKMRLTNPNMRIISRPDDGLTGFARALFTQKNEPSLRATFCGAHNTMYIFDAFGDIYACWEKTGDVRIRVGHITPAGKLELSPLNVKWRSRTVITNSVCRQCRYALYCGGGCAVLAAGRTSDDNMFTNYCDGYAARFRSAVAEAYIDHLNGVTTEFKTERLCDL